MWFVVTLDIQDAKWAWKFGLSYGAWYPDLGAALQTILQGFSSYAQQPLNDAAIAHGHWLYQTGRRGQQLTPEQVHSLTPYLAELGARTAEAMEIAIYYRRYVWDTKRRDVRVPHPHTRGVEKFSRAAKNFRDNHPELRFYSQATVSSDHRAAPEPTPPAVTTAGFATAPPPVGSGTDKAIEAAARSRPAKPSPQPYGVSHAGAEAFVAVWMEHLGATGVRVTQLSGDGGIDVASRTFIAQVKNLSANSAVPVSAIRDLAGVASVDGRRAAMFTSGGYSAGGIAFADSARIALFRYDAVRGTLSATNRIAREVRSVGMG